MDHRDLTPEQLRHLLERLDAHAAYLRKLADRLKATEWPAETYQIAVDALDAVTKLRGAIRPPMTPEEESLALGAMWEILKAGGAKGSGVRTSERNRVEGLRDAFR